MQIVVLNQEKTKAIIQSIEKVQQGGEFSN